MLRPGDVLDGKYEILAELSAGGMATLFLARQMGVAGFRRRVAVKVVHRHLESDPTFARMFVDEAHLSARIHHPNVVRVEDLGQVDGSHYLVMEYIAGCSLSDFLHAVKDNGERVPTDVAVYIAAAVAEALHAAHTVTDDRGQALGLVHRDVSPQNVLLDFNGHVKLIDFGVAKVRDNATHTATGVVKGKLRYMSPEQASGQPLDARTDVYALAIVLWETLTLRRMFVESNELMLLDAVRKPRVGPPSAFNPAVPAALDAAVLRALEPDVTKRTPSALAFRRALVEALPGALGVDAAQVSELIGRLLSHRVAEEQQRLSTDMAVPPVGKPGSSPLNDPSVGTRAGGAGAQVPAGPTGATGATGSGIIAERASDARETTSTGNVRTSTENALPRAQPDRGRRWLVPVLAVGGVIAAGLVVVVGLQLRKGGGAGAGAGVGGDAAVGRVDVVQPTVPPGAAAQGPVRPPAHSPTRDAGSGAVPSGATAVALVSTRLGGRVVDVDTSGKHTCAVRPDGALWCWGNNDSGQLGDGTTSARTVPTRAQGVTAATRVTVGDGYTCVVLRDGSVRCTGVNTHGELGDGTLIDPRGKWVTVRDLSGVRQITTGASHTCALVDPGALRCWGNNSDGELGNGDYTTGGVPSPVDVAKLLDAVAVTAALGSNCALESVGTLRCWGGDVAGELGGPVGKERHEPTLVRGVTGVTSVAMGGEHTCAARSDGSVVCWGDNSFGQLGRGNKHALRGVQVVLARGAAGPSPLRDAAELCAGETHTCARMRDGTAVCWGYNDHGQLGDMSRDAHAEAVAVVGLSGVAQIVCNGSTTCARRDDGSLWCWGDNTSGQLGDGTTNDAIRPQRPQGAEP